MFGGLKRKVKAKLMGKIIANAIKGSGAAWRLLDGQKRGLVLLLAMAQYQWPTWSGWEMVRGVMRSLGWDAVAPAADPVAAMTVVLGVVAVVHWLAKMFAQFRALRRSGASWLDALVGTGTVQGATAQVGLGFKVPVMPEWAKVVLGVLRRLLNAGADKGIWYERTTGPGKLSIIPQEHAIAMPQGWWAKLRAKLFAAIEKALASWLEGTVQKPPEPDLPPVIEEPEDPTGPVVPVPDPAIPDPPAPPVVIPPPAVKPRIVSVSLEPTYRTVKRGRACQIRVLVEREGGILERGGMGLEPSAISGTPTWSASVAPGTPQAAYATIGAGGPKPRDNASPEPAIAFGGVIYTADKGAAANIKTSPTCPLGPLSVRCEITLDGHTYAPALSGDKAPQVVAG